MFNSLEEYLFEDYTGGCGRFDGMDDEMLYELVLLATSITFLGILIISSYKNGPLKSITTKQSVSDVRILNSNDKASNCANLLKICAKFRGVMGESNSSFWRDRELMNAMDLFLANPGSQMSIVVGPELDVESRDYFKKLIQGMEQGKIKLYKANYRNDYHIKEFTILNNKGNYERIIVSELRHEKLEQPKFRKDLLYTNNNNYFMNEMDRYFSWASRSDNAEPVGAKELTKKFEFIKYDQVNNKPVGATNEEIMNLEDYLYSRNS